MQRALIAVWTFLAAFLFASIIMHATATLAQSQGTTIIAPTTAPPTRFDDNPAPPPMPLAVAAPEVGRAIRDLEEVKVELLRSEPDRGGRRARALQYVNSALEELRRAPAPSILAPAPPRQ